MHHRPCVEQLESRRLLASGDLDPTFGNHNGIELPARESRAGVRAAVQQDGRVVVAGHADGPLLRQGHAICVWQFNRDGSLDRIFGKGGVVRADLSPHEDESVRDVQIDASGRIVVAGSTRSELGAYTGTFLARFRADGTPDQTFGQGRGFTISQSVIFGWEKPDRFELIVEPNGDLLLGGNTGNGSVYGQTQLLLARFKSNGMIDRTFGQAGIAIADFGHAERAAGLSLGEDGEILFAGSSGLARFSEAGVFLDDRSDLYDWNGQTPHLVQDAEFLPDGRIALMAPSSRADAALLLVLNADGSRDADFSSDGSTEVHEPDADASERWQLLSRPTDGQLFIDFGLTYETSGYDLHLTPLNTRLGEPAVGVTQTLPCPNVNVTDVQFGGADDSLLAVGYAGWPHDVAVARYTSDGTPDSSFGGDGDVVVRSGSITGTFAVTAVQADGKILAGGRNGIAPQRALLARFNTDGSPDLTFGRRRTGFVTLRADDDEVTGIIVLDDGRVVVASRRSIARFNADGSIDLTFANRHGVLPRGAGAIARLADGRLLAGAGQKVLVVPEDGNPKKVRELPRLNLVGRLGQMTWRALRLLDDGRILVGGSATLEPSRAHAPRYPVVVRLLAEGRLDRTFHRDGIVVIERDPTSPAADPRVLRLAVRGDGRVLALCDLANRARLVQLKTDGTIDPSFGNRTDPAAAGVTFTFSPDPTSTDPVGLGDVLLQPDGKALVVGAVHDWRNGLTSAAVARFDPDGAFDATFGVTGIVTTPLGWNPDRSVVGGLCFAADGSVIFAGADPQSLPALAKLLV
jgi:uncharacterized delta-60 repeat protein